MRELAEWYFLIRKLLDNENNNNNHHRETRTFNRKTKLAFSIQQVKQSLFHDIATEKSKRDLNRKSNATIFLLLWAKENERTKKSIKWRKKNCFKPLLRYLWLIQSCWLSQQPRTYTPFCVRCTCNGAMFPLRQLLYHLLAAHFYCHFITAYIDKHRERARNRVFATTWIDR